MWGYSANKSGDALKGSARLPAPTRRVLLGSLAGLAVICLFVALLLMLCYLVFILLPPEGAVLVYLVIGCSGLYVVGAVAADWRQEHRALQALVRFNAETELFQDVALHRAAVLRERGVDA